MNHFDRQGTPEGGSTRDGENGRREDSERDGASEIFNDSRIEEAAHQLRSYCFVSTGWPGRELEMHELIQLATRKCLNISREDKR